MYKEFTVKDIVSVDTLNENIELETDRIFESDKARRGRAREDIQGSVRQGKIAEQYLIDHYGFTEADIRWHDLINQNGDYVEVKAYSIDDHDTMFVKRDIHRYRTEAWSKSKWYVLFGCKDGNYKHLATIRLK